jgi:hypothetical protein
MPRSKHVLMATKAMKLALAMALLLLPLGCGSNSVDGGKDLGAGDGQPCVTQYDCPGPQYVCAYPIADGCKAKGHCVTMPAETCQLVTMLCGCGMEVAAGCFYPDGYAGGPTTGARFCGDGGTH